MTGQAAPVADLRGATRIPGARALSVVSLATGTVVWSWAGGEPAGTDGPGDGGGGDALGGVLTDIALAAAHLVRVTDAGQPVDDLVLTSMSWFHVLRPVLAGEAQHVVHLLLDRSVANLALARWELKALLHAQAVPALVLPRRAGAVAVAPPRAAEPDGGVPTWYAMFAGELFEDDTHTLNRVLAGLRELG
ncbi:MAG TPA: hypothetical protein VJT31_36255 [Rugosimonospora sp.]|nr:hypothetical protein [Rugosimonospora sp.]